MSMKLAWMAAAAFAVGGAVAPAAAGELLSGERTAYLQSLDGERIKIATVSFGEGGSYAISLDDGPFTDHFLSMRPFQCLESPQTHWCYVPYPYDLPRMASADSLVDLEYDFLFIFKGATEYGINPWNGVYYRLTHEGDRLIGAMNLTDIGLLAAPPPEGVTYPLKEWDIEETDPDGHWLPILVIE